MNLWSLALAQMRYRKLSHVFNILVLTLGIATIVALIHLSAQFQERLRRDVKGIDLVVGAKGSPLQLILSSVFHIDIPNGNIPVSAMTEVARHPMVAQVIPLSLGDNYAGFRIVGTRPEYAAHYSATLAAGSFWNKSMQAVLGSEVARRTASAIGDTFTGSHGLAGAGDEHEEAYVVTGILQPTGTVLDRLVLTDLSSVWEAHEHHHHPDREGAVEADAREITALLVRYRSPMGVIALPRWINAKEKLQAASPSFETARLLRMLGVGQDIVRWFGSLLLAISALGFFVTLFNAVKERQYDLALLRALGTTRRKVLALILMEGMLLGIVGAAGGMLLGHGFAFIAAWMISADSHMNLPRTRFLREDGIVVLGAVGLSAIASLFPAWLAYHMNVGNVLAKGS